LQAYNALIIVVKNQSLKLKMTDHFFAFINFFQNVLLLPFIVHHLKISRFTILFSALVEALPILKYLRRTIQTCEFGFDFRKMFNQKHCIVENAVEGC
jgi:hypothetical protein